VVEEIIAPVKATLEDGKRTLFSLTAAANESVSNIAEATDKYRIRVLRNLSVRGGSGGEAMYKGFTVG